MRYGFFDKQNNVFYEVGSKAEYEQCLQYYQKMLEEEEKKRMEGLGCLEDFEDLIGDVAHGYGDSAFPEMREY